jgi:hypothetical protein
VLLLVLIFVLAAFGLLLVALVTGTAAWAWVSVVVSVAAAGLLVYDWAQRRAAVRSNGVGERARAGARPTVPVHIEESPTTAIPLLGNVPEPPTEVFPALRSEYSASSSGADEVKATADSMPSDSFDRPSGAEPDVSTSRVQQSPSVISTTSDSSNEADAVASERPDDRSMNKPDAEFGKVPAVAAGAVKDKVSGVASDAKSAEGPATKWAGEPKQGELKAPKQGEQKTVEQKTEGGAKPAQPQDDYSQWQPLSPDSAGRQSTTQDGAGQPSERKFVPKQQPYGQLPSQQSAASQQPLAQQKSAGAPPAGQSRPTRDADRTTAISSAAAAVAAAGLSAAAGGQKEHTGKPPVSEADPTTALPIMAGTQRPGQPPVQDKPLDRAEATQAIITVKGAPPPEPAEEKSDAAALATVSKLADEVLVVDEHPRFHLAGCRVLASSETIPLAAKEAVEYGFSPCAVCSPVRVLASRNRAASSS